MTIYKNRYQALKHKSDFEVVTAKVTGGYANFTLSEWELFKRTK